MKKVWIYSLVSIFLFIVMNIVKGNLELLDLKLFYFPSQLDAYFLSFTEFDKKTYLKVNIIDFIFMGTLTMALVEAYRAFFLEAGYFKSLVWVPLAFLFFDTIETSIIFFKILYENSLSEFLKIILCVSTPAKWFFVLSSFLVILNGFLVKKYLSQK